jgi:hypothetical protein
MTARERQLAALAAKLIGNVRALTPPERRLLQPKTKVSPTLVEATRKHIRAGGDPLGDSFCALRSPEKRRKTGATYTPTAIINAMIAWAAAGSPVPSRIVDAGAGSGRFIAAAARTFPKARLVAVESDPLAAVMLRANAAVLGFASRLNVMLCDYRKITLPRIEGRTLFIGNPPYVRHHEINEAWKTWFANTARRFNLVASKLAGLHIHFFLKTRDLATPGDYGAFITAAEWIDVNYGAVLRRLLADGLGGTALHVIDPKAMPFAGTFSTGVITCFRVGRRPEQFTVRTVDSLAQLAPLSAGRAINWSDMESAPRWSVFLRSSQRARQGEIELGELFRVHRGQVTGCNAVWIAGREAAGLPARSLFPTITKARELITAGEKLDSVAHLRNVVDLPVELDQLDDAEREAVEKFLAWAKRAKADKTFIATHRRAWWAVGLKPPAPILCTYMARRAPAFVLNHAGARHLNIAHGLYPVQPLSNDALNAIVRHLSATVCTSAGRVYAGGLVKFEPGEVSRLHIPEPSALHASA